MAAPFQLELRICKKSTVNQKKVDDIRESLATMVEKHPKFCFTFNPKKRLCTNRCICGRRSIKIFLQGLSKDILDEVEIYLTFPLTLPVMPIPFKIVA